MKIKEVKLTGYVNSYIISRVYEFGYRVVYAKDGKLSCTHFHKVCVPDHILPEQLDKYFRISVMKEYNGNIKS
jgi:hypothetical protein